MSSVPGFFILRCQYEWVPHVFDPVDRLPRVPGGDRTSLQRAPAVRYGFLAGGPQDRCGQHGVFRRRIMAHRRRDAGGHRVFHAHRNGLDLGVRGAQHPGAAHHRPVRETAQAAARHHAARTIGVQRYAAALRAPVAVIITIVMILFAVADIKGFAVVLQVYYGVSPVWVAAIVALAVSVYVTLGGFSAVVWTDFLQYLLLAIFAIAMAFAAVDAAAAIPTSAGEMLSLAALFGTVPDGWWNPLSVGIPVALIFSLSSSLDGLRSRTPGSGSGRPEMSLRPAPG